MSTTAVSFLQRALGLGVFKVGVALGLVIFIVVPVMAQGTSATPVLDRIRSTGKITLAHAEDFMPFSYYDPENKPIGYSIDLCRKLAEAVKAKLKLKDLAVQYTLANVGNRVELVEQGKADLECGVTPNNAERRKRVAFTVPHYITGVRYAVLAKNTATDIAQMQGKRMVTVAGTTAAKEVVRVNNERLLRLQISEQKDDVAAFRMLERGETDAIALDEALLIGLIASRPNPALFKIIGKQLTIEPLAIMMNKADAEFKRTIDDEMKRIVNSREIYGIYDKWFTKPIEPNNLSMAMPLGLLLRDFWKYPSDQVPF